tara:strand:+ start:516 stop:944 length:429 start_codon:yes stop_codon:yes gene_type:complete
MIFFRNVFFNLIVILLLAMSSQLLADDNKSTEEPLPLNDPFVGDSSFSGGVKVISDGTSSAEQKRIDLFNYKLVGIIRSNEASFITLINQDGENVTLEMYEELNEGIKLVDMNQKEAIFLVEESDSYLIMNFKNEIKETSEY